MFRSTFCRVLLRFGGFLAQNRAPVIKPVQRCYVSDCQRSVWCGPDRHLQTLFRRRLRATCQRFSPTDHPPQVHGLQHLYFIGSNGIYRNDSGNEDQASEQVLDLTRVLNSAEWSVQRIRLSPREKHLAVTVKEHHQEDSKCFVMKLEQEPLPPSATPPVAATLEKVLSFEWVTDEVLFYTALEDLRSSAVFSLDLRDDGKITTVFEEARPDVFVELGVTRDQELLTINCSTRSSSEVFVVRREDPAPEPRLVQRRTPGLLYHVEHWRGALVILASTGPGQEYQLVQTSLQEPALDSWITLHCPPPGFIIKDLDVCGDFCVLTTRTTGGHLGLTVVPLNKPDQPYFMKLPHWACAVGTRRSPGAGSLEFWISSPVLPPLSFCLVPDQSLVLSHQDNKNLAPDLHRVSTSRLEARSQDGSSVPVTLLHAADLEALDEAPLLVHVYGSYGRDLDMEFSPKCRFLLEQGWALAYCHVRGGGECGLSWSREARVEGKLKSVEDLLACLQLLSSSGVSSPSLTALSARSAGAVPVGAVCNLHPHLVQAVTLQAPFVDVLDTLQDSSLPLTIEDREEWGDPSANPDHRLVIAKYCPLHNITPQKYPSMLLTAYSGDSRVPLSGILKYTEKLRKAVQSYFSSNPDPGSEKKPQIVLNVQPGTSHHGPDDFDLMLNEDGLELAFLYTELGLKPPQSFHRRRR